MFVSLATSRRLLGAAAVVALALAPARLVAQTAAEHNALGDRDHVALKDSSALHHYEEAIKADPRLVVYYMDTDFTNHHQICAAYTQGG